MAKTVLLVVGFRLLSVGQKAIIFGHLLNNLYNMERTIIKEGFGLLKREKRYNQLTVVQKLKYLNFSIVPATFSNILRDVKVKEETLDLVSRGIQELIEVELGHGWERNGFIKQDKAGWQPIEVREATLLEFSIVLNPGFVFHADGRLAIEQKVEFFSTAQKEVIEFGLTLNTFSSYFISRKDREFKSHVEALLQKGVNFKCYMLDPECNEASVYFEDRRREQKDEIRNIEILRDIIRRLASIKRELDNAGYPGTFEVFAYKHIPYNYFMVVDGATPNGKMMVSHYLYGISRAKCPVIEFSKSNNLDLYRNYWSSLQRLTKGAKPISLNV